MAAREVVEDQNVVWVLAGVLRRKQHVGANVARATDNKGFDWRKLQWGCGHEVCVWRVWTGDLAKPFVSVPELSWSQDRGWWV